MSGQVLDELFDESVYRDLRSSRIAPDCVGSGFGRRGWSDEEIVRAPHGSRKTFHTRDQGFFDRRLCNDSYCIICYEVPIGESASFIRRLLRHPSFNSRAKRLGKMVRVTPRRIEFWPSPGGRKEMLDW